jgi:class 3 adenylate cyclase
VRVGIGTGLVVVGDLTGEGEARERGIVGETPNLAARLQALAEPGTVVIGPSPLGLTGELNYVWWSINDLHSCAVVLFEVIINSIRQIHS